jgi:NAD(P)-dependent dehydrogenase (short-subunit alcohol dehydrogenase family)
MASIEDDIPANDIDPALSGRRFVGKTVFITGAQDRGIGAATARRMGAEGAAIAIGSLVKPERLLKHAERLGYAAEWWEMDVREPESVTAALAATMIRFGRLDVLVNNAGLDTAAPLESFAEDEWLAILRVNLEGAIRCTRLALPHLTRPGGVIVNVASALGIGGNAGYSVYSASKAGLIGFTTSLGWELAPQRIRVVGVGPGMVHSPMTHRKGERLKPEVWDKIHEVHPLGMGRPDDVAPVIAFLASEDARWVTGVTLPVGWAPHFLVPDAMIRD